MKGSAVSLFALVVAIGAVVLVLLREPVPAAVAHDATADESGIDDLDRRLVDIESDLARLAGEIASLREARSSGREPVSAVASRAGPLEERLETLEKLVAKDRAASQELLSSGSAETITGRKLGVRRREPDLDASIRTARDPAAAESDRLESFRRLRGSKLPGGTDARLQVLAPMVELGETSYASRHRAEVWRQFSGLGDPSLVTPLLNALRHDRSARVREEAAETLGDYVDDPAVREALEFAAGNDESYDVRAKANASLARKKR